MLTLQYALTYSVWCIMTICSFAKHFFMLICGITHCRALLKAQHIVALQSNTRRPTEHSAEDEGGPWALVASGKGGSYLSNSRVNFYCVNFNCVIFNCVNIYCVRFFSVNINCLTYIVLTSSVLTSTVLTLIVLTSILIKLHISILQMVIIPVGTVLVFHLYQMYRLELYQQE